MQKLSKVWKKDELPLLFTPINSKEILANKFLTISFAYFEQNYTTPDNFAYANIDLAKLIPL